MRTVVINGEPWRVIRVDAGDPRLVDRTGSERLATTDPASMTISISSDVQPPLLDRVVLHEVSHAIAMSHGLLEPMRRAIRPEHWVQVEEWAAQMMEGHAIEAIIKSSEVLGRRVCIRGECRD